MQIISPTQTVDTDTPGDTWQAGEEAARAVARMRDTAIDSWDQIAHFTRAVLAENGLSYREQEQHTGVGASTVYRMALGNAVGVRAVQQFAAFAAYGSRCHETEAFWTATLARFKQEQAGTSADSADVPEDNTDAAAAGPEDIASLYAALMEPASRKAVVDLLRALQASEKAG